MSESKIYYTHYNRAQLYEEGSGRMIRCKPEMATIAVQRRDDKVYVACAKCGPTDQFCKKTGRIKSAGKLYSKSAEVYGVDDDFTVSSRVHPSIVKLIELAKKN